MTNIENRNLENFSEQFELIIRNMNCVAYKIDEQTFSPVYFEGNLKSITGYDAEEFIAKKIEWKNIILPDDYSIVKNESEKILSIKNYIADNEYRILHKSGEVKWIRDIAKKVYDHTTNRSSICGTLFDITKNKETEEALRENEERYKLFFENNSSITLIIDPDSQKILDANAAACNYYGWTREQLIKMEVSEINTLPPEEIKKEIESARIKKRKYFVFKHRLSSGSVRDVEVFSGPIRLKGKEVLYSVVQDITEKKLLEENLLQNQFMIDHARDTIFWIGSDSRILYVNESACSFLGYTKEELLNLTIYDIDPHFNKDMWQAHWENSRQRQAYIIETQHKTKNGKLIPVEISINFIVFGGKEYHAAFGRDISERKQIEDNLHKYKYILEESQRVARVGSWELDIKTNKLTWSDETYRIYGVDKNDFEMTFENVINKIYEEDKEWVLKKFNEASESKTFETYDYRIQKPDGSVSWINITGNVYTDISGKSVEMIGTVRDITDQKKYERALRASEDKFSKAFHTSPDAVNINRLHDGLFIEINDGFTKQTLYTKEDVIGKNSLDIDIWLNPKTRNDFVETLNKKGEVNNFEVEFKIKDGSIKTCLMSARVIEIDGERCILTITRDITERKFAEKELRLRSAALEAAANAIVITDNKGIIIWANASFQKLTGYKPKEVIGKNPNFLKSGLQQNEYYQTLWQTISEGNIWRGEIINKRKDNSLYTEEMTITPLKDDEGSISHYIAIKQDVTERKKFEVELLHAKEKAEVSEELKSAFLAQMSHEIRSPLYRILGYISLIKEIFETSDIKNTSEVIEYFSSIDLSSRRLTKTIDSILNMSELQTQSYQPSLSKVNINALMEQLRKEHLQQAGLKMINLYITPVTKNSTIICDEYSVTQIFANLIDNALKYTAKGEVQIIINRNKRKQLFVEVRDTGIGISQKFINQLFNPFTQEETGYSRKFEGNGLGLALVKSYCDINHADVEVESEKGKGTTFRVTFK